ncbi:MAG: pectate lyase [Bacteroidota bacterium]|nr:pectate lyase [Bacteroidota bacterium]
MIKIKHNIPRIGHAIYILLLIIVLAVASWAQQYKDTNDNQTIDTTGFIDSTHHWYDIYDEDKVITPSPHQPRYKINQIVEISDNILLYQKLNGGWPKNYDMLAILTEEQKYSLQKVKEKTNTTFDNGATHSQIHYLAKAYTATKIGRFKAGCLRGIDFILAAQYPNGGFPQFFPDTSGYRKYITFNDGAMIGVMKVLHDIIQNKPWYSFVDSFTRIKVLQAFDKGVECILKCQIIQHSKLAGWSQQHDNVNFRPQGARTFEPAALGGEESADIVRFLMSLENPSLEIISAIQTAVKWLKESQIYGIRVETIEAPAMVYKYSTSKIDRVVVEDPKAVPIWARLYELGTNKPLFCNRDGIPVYSLAEVERERRSGYSWYTYEPDRVFKEYPKWQKKWAPDNNELK